MTSTFGRPRLGSNSANTDAYDREHVSGGWPSWRATSTTFIPSKISSEANDPGRSRGRASSPSPGVRGAVLLVAVSL